MYRVTLTDNQMTVLEMYVRKTAQMRKEEQAACERMGLGKRAKEWADTEDTLQAVLAALDRAEEGVKQC